MLKIKCSKYPEEKCVNYENRTFKDCKLCIYNMYHSLESINNSKDYFKKLI